MRWNLIVLIFIFSSCAKISYVTEQGLGQISLEWNAEDNDKILMDPSVKEEHKEKIKKIENYKTFFYKYFDTEETSIYSETTILKQDAVTYLVIASKTNEVSPLMISFPFVGEFPYLGFFNKNSAQRYKEKLEKEGFSTYMRPVYAYSTLNKLPFYDNILSSFFIYNDQELAELIFHELTHTLFFAENEVEFNESFAEYIGRELSYDYFQYQGADLIRIQNTLEAKKKLMEHVAISGQELNILYKKDPKLSEVQAREILQKFLKKSFIPKTKMLCENLLIKKCWPLKHEWNNAKFAAFITYTRDQDLIAKIHSQRGGNLKDFFMHIEKRYEEYQKTSHKSFSDYLKIKEKI